MCLIVLQILKVFKKKTVLGDYIILMKCFFLKVHLKSILIYYVLIRFCCALKKYTYFDVLTNM